MPSEMSDRNAPSLPVEILVMIAEFLDQSSHAQKEMYNFCLVGRAWYMAGIKLLYRRPKLARGSRFSQFTSTIIPPIRTKKQKVDLASLVERLSLGQLVHQSSPSQTARLLKATSSSLIEFRAPRISFAINSLAGLSKCQKLRYLDLSLVMGDSVDFPKLKKAISGLEKLEYLALPSSMSLTHTNESVGQWPQLLTELRVGGRVDYELLLTYCWPQNLETLSFSKCIDLNTFQLGAVVANEQIKQGLKKLIIGLDNYGLADDILRPAHEISFYETFWSMEKLLYLKIPADFAFKFFETVDEVTAYASLVTPLRALEITSSLDNEWMHDSHFSILLYNMICLPFQNVWSLVVWKDVWSVLHDREYHHGQLIEDEIWLHVPEEDDPYLNSPEFARFESMHPLGLSLGVETIDDHVY